jgi:hypothetical protein
MMLTDEERIRQLIEELDQLTPRDGACVRLEQYGSGPDEGRFVANLTGYLRFGIEFLKGGIARPQSTEPSHSAVHVDLEYLLCSDSVIGFDEFIRDDALANGRKSQNATGSFVGRVLAVGITTACVLMVALAVVGIIAVVQWLS